MSSSPYIVYGSFTLFTNSEPIPAKFAIIPPMLSRTYSLWTPLIVLIFDKRFRIRIFSLIQSSIHLESQKQITNLDCYEMIEMPKKHS